LVAAQEKSAITRSVARVAISLNSARSTLIRHAARKTRLTGNVDHRRECRAPAEGSGEICHWSSGTPNLSTISSRNW
jgi:hypothetical protein